MPIWRPWRNGYSGSETITVVKQRMPRSGMGWVTVLTKLSDIIFGHLRASVSTLSNWSRLASFHVSRYAKSEI